MSAALALAPSTHVIPAKAGIQFTRSAVGFWIPAFAGMTAWLRVRVLG